MDCNKMMSLLNDDIVENDLRPYSGLSGIGNPCMRYLQYYHYWAFKESISTRVERLFKTGHLYEDLMASALKTLGIDMVFSQKEYIGFAGHWKGHSDGNALISKSNELSEGYCDTFLVEMKTHNDKNFKALKKDKVQKAFPKHYAQMCAYMEEDELEYCLYIAINKNDSEYHIEWIRYDADESFRNQSKQEEVIMSPVLLSRIASGKKTWFECKLCSARDVCFNATPVVKSCRTCEHISVEEKGAWRCTKHNKELSVTEQRAACGDYAIDEMFHE